MRSASGTSLKWSAQDVGPVSRECRQALAGDRAADHCAEGAARFTEQHRQGHVVVVHLDSMTGPRGSDNMRVEVAHEEQ